MHEYTQADMHTDLLKARRASSLCLSSILWSPWRLAHCTEEEPDNHAGAATDISLLILFNICPTEHPRGGPSEKPF